MIIHELLDLFTKSNNKAGLLPGTMTWPAREDPPWTLQVGGQELDNIIA